MVTLTQDSPALAEHYDVAGLRQFEHGKLLLQDLGLARGEHVLDVGCGTGRLTELAAQIVGAAGSVVGVDPLPLRIDIAARRRLANLVFRTGQAEDLSAFPAGRFDAVVLNSVFHWLPEKSQPLAEAFRVLHKGGRLGISTATTDAPHQINQILESLRTSGRFGGFRVGTIGTPHRVGSEELQRLFTAAGFARSELRLRSFTDTFASPEEVASFNAASAFGNFLGDLDASQKEALVDALYTELESLRTDDGIRLQRHLIFAVAYKE
ncbi:methyltransferase domain-containing protein [Niveibacterium sp. SC-1]|uniref:class I SAM-dependent methyltransferase n=1 Tax=Niveibacterium sp. SC-1 TaxID=3135646 RepID=UPI00311FB89C